MRWNITVECIGEDGQRSTIALGTIKRLAASTTAENLVVQSGGCVSGFRGIDVVSAAPARKLGTRFQKSSWGE
jgi:hypothetical protein